MGRAPVVISGIEHRKPRPRRPPFQRQPGEATARRGTKIMPFGNSDSLAVGLFVQGKNVSEKVKFPLLPALPLGEQLHQHSWVSRIPLSEHREFLVCYTLAAA